MAATNNSNLMQVRLEPARVPLVRKLQGEREKDGDFLRRAIDALAEKEGVKNGE